MEAGAFALSKLQIIMLAKLQQLSVWPCKPCYTSNDNTAAGRQGD